MTCRLGEIFWRGVGSVLLVGLAAACGESNEGGYATANTTVTGGVAGPTAGQRTTTGAASTLTGGVIGTGGATGAAAVTTTGNIPNPLSFEGTESGLVFSMPRGVYDAPVSVTISHPSATEVRYTLDGSDPRGADALVQALPLTLQIDPADTTNRYLAPGVVVRATADGSMALPAAIVTHTYLFLSRVAELSPDGESPGGDWPEPGGGTSGGGFGGPQGGGDAQAIDYGIDPDVSESTAYATEFQTGLVSIPSLSLVTDLPHLFDDSTGIYVNASEKGVEWERFGSVELLSPDNGPGFQANTGIRIRGGYSRSGQNPKHAFRLFFRAEEYGTPKLRFPLFGAEGADAFDRLDLRTSQNYSWSFEGDLYDENVMTRDVFSRDLQRELGRPYTRSRYYHLFINGVYWGLYQSQERVEANFGRTYFGGATDDYDVIKANRDTPGVSIEASEGTDETWQAVWQLVQAGFADDANYFALQGQGPTGLRDPALPVLMDIDNLSDYMLVIFYTGNFDAPVSKFFENQSGNNFYAIKSRVNLEQGFTFFAHDNEHTLLADPVRVTTGVDENRVNIGQSGQAANEDGEPDDDYLMQVEDFENFHPQWLHERLSENASYRQRFGLRAQALLTGTGPMTSAPATALFQARVDEIDTAIVVESARWGDAQAPNSPRTKNDDWLPAVERVKNDYLAVRSEIVIGQLQALGLYPQ